MFRSYRDPVRIPVKGVVSEETKKYFCDLCHDKTDQDEEKQSWDCELDFEIHRRKVHKLELIKLMREPKNHMCSVCLRAHPSRAALISHIKKYHLLSGESSVVKRELYICDYCTNVFFNKNLLIAHIKYYHLSYNKTSKKTICPVCSKNVYVKTIWFHFLYHEIHIATCPVCLETFADGEEMVKHIDSHPGYYKCNICSFQSHTDNLFQRHKEKHKKPLNRSKKLKDINDIARFFVPQRRPVSWTRRFNNLFRGITLSPEIQICVLCRAMCDTDMQMIQHIHGDHAAVKEVDIKRHLCTCGEEFFNNVLLRHHIFTLKGDHHVYNGTKPKPLTKSNQLKNSNQTEIEIVVDMSGNGNNQLEDSTPVATNKQIELTTDVRKEETIITDNDVKETGTPSDLPEQMTCEDGDYEVVYQICTEEEGTKTFETSKEYYEGALSLGEETTDDLITDQAMQYDNQEVVYEVLEVAADSSEDAGKIILL